MSNGGGGHVPLQILADQKAPPYFMPPRFLDFGTLWRQSKRTSLRPEFRLEFGDLLKGRSLISANRSLAIAVFEKLSTAL